MLTFYYHPLSPIARRVWLALLEKEIAFEPVVVDLRGKQFEADFLALNPFHHVPVIVHDGVRILESLAILDYLELQFPQRSLLATGAIEVARMRMVQMVVMNELMPKLVACAIADEDHPIPASTTEQIATCFRFLSQQLEGEGYFGGQDLNLADIVAGATVPLFVRLGISLRDYPALENWHQNIVQRSAWQQTAPADEVLEVWRKWIKLQAARKQQQMTRAQAA